MSHMKNIGRILLTGASLAALGAGAAYAQDGEEGGNEIVVTATGRTAVLQEVPIAVTALSAEAIENAGVQDLRDIEQITPSYRFFTGQSNAAGTSAIVRGIGTGGDNPGFESAVGFFIDGVYRNRSGVALSELPEVQRIEVLRGPQGTLFGRNTTAGAISVVTAGPEFTPRVMGEVTAGDFGSLGATALITGPLADNFAARLEGNIQARDGYINEVNEGRDINDRNRWYLRGQALWDVAPTMSIRVIADVAQTDEECCTAISLQQGAPAAAINAIAAAQGLVGMAPLGGDNYNVALSPNRDYLEAVDEWGISADVSWDLGGMTLTSITSYRDWSAERNQDIDFSGIDRAYREGYEIGFETFTQELRLQGEAGWLDWLVGVFYANEELELTDTIRFGQDSARYVDFLTFGITGTGQLFGTLTPFGCVAVPGVPPCLAGPGLAAVAPQAGQGQQADVWGTSTSSLAVFTHNEISLGENLTWTIGLRFNSEEKDLSANLLSVAPACNLFNSLIDSTPGVSAPSEALFAGIGDLRILICNPAINTQANGTFADSTEEEEISGTTSLRYQVTPDFMVYGGYSRGYKAGGFNLDRSGFQYSLGLLTNLVTPNTDQLAFDPEFVDAYEVGFKSTIFNGTTTLNATYFYQDITDFQLNAFSGFNFIVFNVPEAVTQGVEVDLSYQPNSQLTINGGMLYNDATFESTVIDPTLGTLVPPLITAGTPVAQAPEWTFSGSVTYEFPVSEAFTGKIYLDGRWNSDYRTATLNRNPITDNESYSIFNGRVGLAHRAGWSVEAFVQNITDEYYFIGSFNVPEQTGNIAVYPNQPRTWGVTVSAEF